MHISEAIAVDGTEYLLGRVSSARVPGYARLEAAESRLVLRDWARRHGVAMMTELCRALGSWRSPEPVGDVEMCIERLAARLDEYCPDLVLHRRDCVAVALDLSPLEDVVSLVASHQVPQ
jgi:hypothetical protein